MIVSSEELVTRDFRNTLTSFKYYAIIVDEGNDRIANTKIQIFCLQCFSVLSLHVKC